ncbi:MAG TPA: RDD family protein [Candidatus Polarisedimenticolia bacterium]|nr:RDD family protein [Candidatus Polarisedimenticolia bacterium]
MPRSAGHKLIIETPELIPLEFTLAGVGSRFLAVAIDSAIQLGLSLVVIIPYIVLAAAEVAMLGSSWALAILVLIIFCIQYGYFLGFEIAWSGQTPGKRRLGLRVIRDSGLQITPNDAIARNLLRLVDQLPGVYAIGILSTVLSSQSKRLGDYVAGTVVVHEAPFEESRPSLALMAEEPVAAAETHRAAGLSAPDLELIETFLDRRPQLDTIVRVQMAHRIAEKIASKLSDAPDQAHRDERWLEAMARAARRSGRFR